MAEGEGPSQDGTAIAVPGAVAVRPKRRRRSAFATTDSEPRHIVFACFGSDALAAYRAALGA